MKSVSAAQMKELDRMATEQYGIPSLLLMENAGRGVAELVYHLSKPGRVTVFSGKGNNGGDGFVVARHLHNRSFQVFVVVLADVKKLKDDPALNYNILVQMKIPTMILSEGIAPSPLEEIIKKSDIIVDAMFGVGLERPLTGVYQSAVEAINRHGHTIVAVDIPSGLHADTGEILGCAVRATHTATLGLPKKGIVMGKGPECCGKVCVIDIGLPKQALEKLGSIGR